MNCPIYKFDFGEVSEEQFKEIDYLIICPDCDNEIEFERLL